MVTEIVSVASLAVAASVVASAIWNFVKSANALRAARHARTAIHKQLTPQNQKLRAAASLIQEFNDKHPPSDEQWAEVTRALEAAIRSSDLSDIDRKLVRTGIRQNDKVAEIRYIERLLGA